MKGCSVAAEYDSMEKTKYREMLMIAIPAILESLFTVLITTIDTKMVSVLGKDAISAVSFTTQPKLIGYSLFFALGTAMSIFIAQAYGKKDREEANRYLRTIIRITIVLAIALGALLSTFAHPIMHICSKQTDTIALSILFFQIIMAGLIFQALSTVLSAALRGIGNTKLTLFSNIAMGITDIIFNFLLIEGHLGFPRLGVAGDAIATVAGSAVACIISAMAVARKTDFLSLRGVIRKGYDGNSTIRKEVRTKAGNIALENIFMRIGFLLSSIVVSCLSSSETAVYSVAMILLNYSFAFGDGIQSAVIALVGKSKGASNVRDIKQYLNNGIMMGVFSSVFLGIIYLSISRWFLGLYFQEEMIISAGIKMIWFVSVITLFQILRIIYIASMRGIGEIRIPKWLATLCVLIINPGTSALFVLVLNMGIWGIWISSIITQGTWYLGSFIFCKKCMADLKEEICL